MLLYSNDDFDCDLLHWFPGVHFIYSNMIVKVNGDNKVTKMMKRKPMFKNDASLLMFQIISINFDNRIIVYEVYPWNSV